MAWKIKSKVKTKRNSMRAGEKNFNGGNGSLLTCYNCKRKGHVEKDYWHKNQNPNVPCCSICKNMGIQKQNVGINLKIMQVFMKKRLMMKVECKKLYISCPTATTKVFST